MSNVDSLVQRMGQDEAENQPMPEGTRWRLVKRDIIAALAKMPDEAAIWSGEDLSEYDAKHGIRDALWNTIEPAVRMMVKAPTGDYVEAR